MGKTNRPLHGRMDRFRLMIDTKEFFERQFRPVAARLTGVAAHRSMINGVPTVSLLADANLVQRVLGWPV
jgi:hypothetical protein